MNFTIGCAARCNTISGCTSLNTSFKCAKSLISPITELILFSTSAIEKRLGSVGASSEYPVTSAPAFTRILQSQEPLNPVCPVTRTFCLYKNLNPSLYLIPS